MNNIQDRYEYIAALLRERQGCRIGNRLHKCSDCPWSKYTKCIDERIAHLYKGYCNVKRAANTGGLPGCMAYRKNVRRSNKIKWIKCSEQLPEHEGAVLCLWWCGGLPIYRIGNFCHINQTWDMLDLGRCHFYSVSHWMEIPELPSGIESREEEDIEVEYEHWIE